MMGMTAEAGSAHHVEELDADGLIREGHALGDVLHACVLNGASVGFVLPFTLQEATAFWLEQEPAVRQQTRRLFVARQDGRIVGTVMLVVGTPPNGRHRAEIMKMLVHPTARRRGIARALLQEAEVLARQLRKSLLVLDTVHNSAAEPLYRSLGYELTGVVPRYACDVHGVLEPAAFMRKDLALERSEDGAA
jgi:GNAT superfamily N-acetyltransferase